jgi:hypothetical protein
LLALKECDQTENERKKTGLENIKKTLQEFQQAWTNVEAVYSQTRFISYPEGYVSDRYFHLASQREDLTWMMQAEEMYFGMLEKWIPNQE